MLLRNDLVAMLCKHDNDPVTADVNGIMIDVEEVTVDRDSIVLILNRDDTASALRLARGAHNRVGAATSGVDPPAEL
jgi:hypothetical protein